MYRVGRWLDRGKASNNASTQSLNSLEESQNLETALRAVELIMNDDIHGAEKGLADGNSAFHKLARGTLGFMKATLGFEQEIMKEASEQLYEAETTASASLHKAQHDSRAFNSNIYDKGAEFSLCQAEAQVMSAIVGVLNESLTESIKGFYKLRKAYMTLDSIVQMEARYMKTREVRSLANSRQVSSESLVSKTSVNSGAATTPVTNSSSNNRSRDATAHANQPSALRNAEVVDKVENDDSEEEFFEAEDDGPEHATEGYTGRLELAPEVDKKLQSMNISESSTSHQPEQLDTPPVSALGLINHGPESAMFANSLDVFIHSGSNLMAGILSLMISVIPPAFSKLLFIIGFRGDRERGLQMLWQASKFSNINGAMAGLVLFGWYNGLVGFCDIVTDMDPKNPEGVEGYPVARLQALLAQMRQRYPRSYLWLVEEARSAASKRELETAIGILSQSGTSQLKQLEALHMFEKGMCLMNSHQYKRCADSFIACVDLNGWSQALYYYIAGAGHLEAYRRLRGTGKLSKEAEKHKKLAEDYFKTAPSKVSKKKMMGRQLPFDGFVIRKIAKWEERATRWNCSFADAVGVSPHEEMIYLWNGFKKMNQAQLEESLQNLAWSETSPHWKEEALDEHAILALVRAVVLRNLRQHDESKEILQVKILGYDSQAFKGHNKDDWPAPAAHYEMAVNLWMQRYQYIRQHGTTLIPSSTASSDLPDPDLVHDTKLVEECKAYIEKAKGWEKYELDARIGMKVTAAYDAIKKWEQKHLTNGK